MYELRNRKGQIYYIDRGSVFARRRRDTSEPIWAVHMWPRSGGAIQIATVCGTPAAVAEIIDVYVRRRPRRKDVPPGGFA